QPSSGTSVVFLSVIAVVSDAKGGGQDSPFFHRTGTTVTEHNKNRVGARRGLGAGNHQVFETAFGKCAMQYSSPSRATRKSRFGSLSSVAPQTAQRWSASVVLRDCDSKRLRRVETSWRCRA